MLAIVCSQSWNLSVFIQSMNVQSSKITLNDGSTLDEGAQIRGVLSLFNVDRYLNLRDIQNYKL